MMTQLLEKRTTVGALAMLVTWFTSGTWTAAQPPSPQTIRPHELAQWTTVGYWIGVRCTNSGTAAEPKVIVGEIIAEAPAAKAGVQTGDHITQVEKQRLTSIDHLAQLIHASRGEPIQVTIVRADKTLDLSITPQERPTANYNVPLGRDPEELADWIEQQANSRLGPGINLRLMSPGIVLPTRQPEIPADTEFTIKRADGMAQVIVRQGTEEWIVSSDKIEELPAETRRWAIQLQNLINGRYGLLHSMPTGFNVVVPQTFPNDQDANDPARVEELQQRIRELQRTIEDLQTQQP